MMRRTGWIAGTAVGALGCIAALGAARAGAASAGAPQGSKFLDEPTGRLFRAVAVIPSTTYTSILVSPLEPRGREPTKPSSAGFMIRARDATGFVEDFAFHVKLGETFVLETPRGWTPTGNALLYSFGEAPFAAWGVTNTGALVRFEEPVLDPNREAEMRDRERELDRVLRLRAQSR